MGQKQHSKRQRKQKAHASLKRKQVQRQDDDIDVHIIPPPRRVPIPILPVACTGSACGSPLRNARREVADSNALILTPAHQDEDGAVPAPEVNAPKLSKSQLRKQRKVQEEHTRRQQRAQVTQSCRKQTFAMHHMGCRAIN